jgi:hypothetical protein
MMQPGTFLASRKALRNSPPGAIPSSFVNLAEKYNNKRYIVPWTTPFCLTVASIFSTVRLAASS